MNIPNSILTMLAGITLTLVSLWYGQNHGLLPVAASAEAELVDGLFNVMMTISVGLVLLVEGVIVVAAVRFRRRKGDEEDGPHIEGNIPLEILWTSIPAVLVLGISVYSFEIYTEMGGLTLGHMGHGGAPVVQEVSYDPESGSGASGTLMAAASTAGIGSLPDRDGVSSLTVDVKALQYAFLFTYPETGILSGELHAPLGQEMRLVMAAQDVIHAFWVPELRLKQDIVPGQTTELAFIPTLAGTYPIICAELCGPYHGGMKAQLIVETPEEYQTWIQSQVAQVDDGTAIANLSQPSGDRTPAEYLAPAVAALNVGVDAPTIATLQPSHHPADHVHAAVSMAAP